MSSSPRTIYTPPGRTGGFTLVEIMIVVTIISLLGAIAVPAYQRARKRTHATAVKEELRVIDNALETYAFETNKAPGTTVQFDELKPYLKTNSRLYATGSDLFGNLFGPQFTVNVYPTPPYATYHALVDVADETFWSPFGIP